MTSETKSNILKYITGKIVPETEVNEPYGINLNSFETTWVDDLESELNAVSNNYTIAGTIQNAEGNMIILYGWYEDTSGNYGESESFFYGKGFIALMTPEFEIIQVIKEYSSGTQLGLFYTISQDEKGQFYGADYTTVSRFILLNNFTMKQSQETDYTLRLRQSYNFPANYIIDNLGAKIFKKPTSADYLWVARKDSSTASIITLTINVGSANEWTKTEKTLTTTLSEFLDSYGSWVGDVFTIKFGGFNSTTYAEYTFTADTLTKQTTTIANSNTPTVKILNQTKTYISYKSTISSVKYFNIALFSSNILTILKTIDDYSSSGYVSDITLYIQGGEVFYYYWSSWSGSPLIRQSVVGHIVNDIPYDIQELEVNSAWTETPLFIVKQFNLYRYFLYNKGDNNVYTAAEIYNPLNYNGLPYEDTNLLVPRETILYDTSDIPIYARNLYNLVVDGNSTVATAQINNTMLNDITIGDKVLLGETKEELVRETTEITKNIYENVLLNFYNNIYMKKGIVYNTAGASLVNTCINAEGQDCVITQYKIIYDDDTYVIRDIDSITITDDVADLEFYFYAPKELKKIQILADNETAYCDIDITGTGYRKINQKVEVI
jgi:hypothetical protein